MVELKISRRYARALFELARDGDTLERIGAQLSALAELFRSNPAMAGFLGNAMAEEDAKRQFLDGLMERLGSDDLLRRFVRLLLPRGRVMLLPQIEEYYKEMAEEHLGVATALVETARPLSAEARERLAQALSRYTGRQVRIVEQIRPELIAGVRVQLGSLLLDGTLERQLSELNRVMLG